MRYSLAKFTLMFAKGVRQDAEMSTWRGFVIFVRWRSQLLLMRWRQSIPKAQQSKVNHFAARREDGV